MSIASLLRGPWFAICVIGLDEGTDETRLGKVENDWSSNTKLFQQVGKIREERKPLVFGFLWGCFVCVFGVIAKRMVTELLDPLHDVGTQCSGP